MYIMTPEFKESWVTSLTDGSFRQATKRLIERVERKETYHCCLAVAGVLAGFNLEDGRPDQLLKPEELRVIGLSYEDQNGLANDNDDYEVPEGRFYPDEVIERIRNLPTYVWPRFEVSRYRAAEVWYIDRCSNISESCQYSYVVCPPPAWMTD